MRRCTCCGVDLTPHDLNSDNPEHCIPCQKGNCEICGPGEDEDTNDCPLGGDVANDCDGCAYSGDYYYDEKSGECVRRK